MALRRLSHPSTLISTLISCEKEEVSMVRLIIIGRDYKTRELIGIGEIESRSGTYILGKSGFGKSAVEGNIAAQAMENGDGVFFLDWHGDAIDDLINRISRDDTSLDALAEFFFLLNPEHETHSIGINPLTCKNLASLRERTDTYTRAYSVFYKLWEDSWGPWLQLILQNLLYAFLESPEFTLAEAPAFLDPRNKSFRTYVVKHMKYNPEVANFWRYEFFSRRERNQQERVDAALTRINTLLLHPYVRHIIGQRETTIDFSTMLAKQQSVFVKLSASLAPDIKKFISTILISELLHAVRNRPQGNRKQFYIIIDEFQHCASSEDFTTLITEARKFAISTVLAHVERSGQFVDNQKLLGATSAAVNKVFFQLTVHDAQELALEFAEKVEASEPRREAELIISPHPIEDIWDKGHPNQSVMALRENYFWLVDRLRSKPNEDYYVFDPARVKTREGNGGTLHWPVFTDWDMYRSSPEMLREGIELLNRYYYERMINKPLTANNYQDRPKSDRELELIFRILELFSGVFGWRPTMEPYIPDDMREVFLHRIKEHTERDYKEFINDIQRINRGWEHDYTAWDRAHPFRGYHPSQQYWGDRPLSGKELEEIINKNRPTEYGLFDIPSSLPIEQVQAYRSYAIQFGLTPIELEKLIQWRIRPLHPLERKPLEELIKIVANIHADNATYEREQNRVYRAYTSIMGVHPMVAQFGENHSSLPVEKTAPYLKKVVERIVWQSTELQHFLVTAFLQCPAALEREPVKIPSGKYDETFTVERTQQDLINERAQELANLPRFTAYAKIIKEDNGRQTVIKRKIETRPLPILPEKPLTDDKLNTPSAIIELNTIRAGLYRPRDQIEKDIRNRREQWLRREGEDKPPPTWEKPPQRHD
jgi:hypothetical protein